MGPIYYCDDVELAKMAAKRNQLAFDTLIARHRERFLSAAQTKATENAYLSGEDIFQDACLHAWEKIHTLNDPESFVSWFVIILLNRAKRCRMKASRYSRVIRRQDEIGEDCQLGELDFVKPSDLRKCTPNLSTNKERSINGLLASMEQLSKMEHDAAFLRFFGGCSYTQIAKTLGITEAQAKTKTQQAQKKLKQEIEMRVDKDAIFAYLKSTCSVQLFAGVANSEKTASQTPELLTAAGATAKGMSSFWSVTMPILLAPLLWLGMLFASLQVLASTLVRNAPNQQTRLWLIRQLLYGYCLTFLLPLLLFWGGYIFADVWGFHLSEAAIIVSFMITLVVRQC